MSMTVSSDANYPDPELSRIAFGSCHSRGALDKRITKAQAGKYHTIENTTIWDTIATSVQPQAFLWTGDAIYPPTKIKGDAPIDVIRNEYNQMLHNETLGYAKFVANPHLVGGVHGVWDDHDYGGNDRGRELQQKGERRDEYLNFLGVYRSDLRRQRQGLYSSIQFGSEFPCIGGSLAKSNGICDNEVRIIFLDTRWHRERHCVPSAGSNPFIPFGAIIACITRWLTAGFDLSSILSPSICPSNKENSILGADQWFWLERELNESSASVHIIVSSIQVLTTNPVVESWGHFPKERDRLLRLLNVCPGLVILSGDVHYAEISTSQNKQNTMQSILTNHGTIIEVTSSGLTHSCDGPRIYGPLCQPILNIFSHHRFVRGNLKGYLQPSYHTGINFGSISFNWLLRTFQVSIHDENGNAILSTGSLGMDSAAHMTPAELKGVSKCVDGHFLIVMKRMRYPMSIIFAVVMLVCRRHFSRLRRRSPHSRKHE